MEPGDLIDGRFAIERLAGRGGMGEVYRALDRVTGGPVAVKVLYSGDPEIVARFEREASVLAELRHPAIVRYVAHGAIDDKPWLAMEWLDGESLGERLDRAALSVSEAVGLCLRVAEALAVAHRLGIVHRDLKPQNLFLLGGSLERVKILDFGIAHLEGGGRLTKTGMMMGTPLFMSPEQARGLRQVDARADVFSLGCVLYRALTGHFPFAATDLNALLFKIVLENPVAPSTIVAIPAALDDLLARMLAKSPEHRPPDAGAVVAELLPLARASASPAAISIAVGSAERRVTSLLVARLPEVATAQISGSTMRMTLAQTLSGNGATPGEARLSKLIQRAGGRLTALADGSIAISWDGVAWSANATGRAAKCALALRDEFPAVHIALVAGRSETSGDALDAELVERGLALLGGGLETEARPRPVGQVRLNEAAASLLAPRFHVARVHSDVVLEAEREVGAAVAGEAPLIGREHDLTLLLAVLDDSVAEHRAGTVLITGPPGIGKSRILAELRARAVERVPELEVVCARGDETRDRVPGALVDDLVWARGAEIDAPPSLGPGSSPASVPMDDGAAGDEAAARALVAAFATATAPGHEGAPLPRPPMLVLIDDLEATDAASIRRLDLALRSLKEQAVLVVAAGRPEALDRHPRAFRDRGVQHVVVRELTKRNAERLVRARANRSDEARVARVIARGAGNPRCLEELLRAEGQGATELPDAVSAIVEASLEGLGADGRRVLRAASVLGTNFTRAALATLLGDGGIVDAWLPTLIERDLVAIVASATLTEPPTYAFRSEVVRDAMYGALPRADRIRAHRAAAGWLESLPGANPSVLAIHWERAGERVRSAAWLRRAAEAALARGEFDRAIEGAVRASAFASGEDQRALFILEGDARRARASREIEGGDGAMALAEIERAIACYGLALDTARLDEARLRAASIALDLGAWARAEQKLGELASPWAELARAQAAAGLGRTDEALERLIEASTALAAAGDVRGEEAARVEIARALLERGDAAGAEARAATAGSSPSAFAVRARALVALGRAEIARGVAAEAVGRGGGFPARLALAEAQEALGLVEDAHATVGEAAVGLFERASRIGDFVLRESYLAIPEHRTLLDRARQA